MFLYKVTTDNGVFRVRSEQNHQDNIKKCPCRHDSAQNRPAERKIINIRGSQRKQAERSRGFKKIDSSLRSTGSRETRV